MLAKAVSGIGGIPAGVDLSYEPKWDGFRSIIFRDGDELEIGSRNEKPMTRYFPELVEALKENLPPRCVLDGEIILVGRSGDRLDFDALQQRIHPAASRVKLLAEQTPASSSWPSTCWRWATRTTPAGPSPNGGPRWKRRSPAARRPSTSRPPPWTKPPPSSGSSSSRAQAWTGSWPNRWTAATSRTNA